MRQHTLRRNRPAQHPVQHISQTGRIRNLSRLIRHQRPNQRRSQLTTPNVHNSRQPHDRIPKSSLMRIRRQVRPVRHNQIPSQNIMTRTHIRCPTHRHRVLVKQRLRTPRVHITIQQLRKTSRHISNVSLRLSRIHAQLSHRVNRSRYHIRTTLIITTSLNSRRKAITTLPKVKPSSTRHHYTPSPTDDESDDQHSSNFFTVELSTHIVAAYPVQPHEGHSKTDTSHRDA